AGLGGQRGVVLAVDEAAVAGGDGGRVVAVGDRVAAGRYLQAGPVNGDGAVGVADRVVVVGGARAASGVGRAGDRGALAVGGAAAGLVVRRGVFLAVDEAAVAGGDGGRVVAVGDRVAAGRDLQAGPVNGD